MVDAVPRMKNMLEMLLPTILPMEMSLCPSMEEMILTTNSGVLVPMPTMEAPMMYSEIWWRRAMAAEPSTNQLAPTTRRARLRISVR